MGTIAMLTLRPVSLFLVLMRCAPVYPIVMEMEEQMRVRTLVKVTLVDHLFAMLVDRPLSVVLSHGVSVVPTRDSPVSMVKSSTTFHGLTATLSSVDNLSRINHLPLMQLIACSNKINFIKK